MDSPELIIVDVGHGNCAILRDTNGTIVIDSGTGSTLIDVLDYLNIRELSSVLISHADEDHIGGVMALLSKQGMHVHPKLILFSIDRNQLVNPREGIIRGIKSAAPTAHIMCTQLSRRCAAQLPNTDFRHLMDLPAKGRITNSCCGGTIAIKLNGESTIDSSLFTLHREFVESNVSTPMCLRYKLEHGPEL